MLAERLIPTYAHYSPFTIIKHRILPYYALKIRKYFRSSSGRILKYIVFIYLFIFKTRANRRKEAWWGSVFELSTLLQCQVNYISTWSGPGERNSSASRECQKDLIIIFGKAMKSDSVMSLQRITLLIASLDV